LGAAVPRSLASNGFETVNDVHSALNPARMRVRRPGCVEEVVAEVRAASEAGAQIAICGGRHAMGGQQFAEGSVLVDVRGMNRILAVDMERGVVRAEGGIQWPQLVAGSLEAQRRAEPGRAPRWGIAQKQTGADALTLGGSLSANVHGRGLLMAPIVADVEEFLLVGPGGQTFRCSRDENRDLFALAIGGYGLFGVIAEVTLRLAPRRTLRRMVRVIDIEEAVQAAERRIEEGYLYGDFQFDIDPQSPDFLTKGVFSGYAPVEGNPEPPAGQRALSREAWLELLTLAHVDKSAAFTKYAQHYIATDGQLYHSDSHQLSEYVEDYHAEVERRIGATCRGSEIITELCVPPERLVEFLRAAANMLVARSAQVIYGTIRLIQPDQETALPWARRRYACIVFNLHVDHEAASVERAGEAFRDLIELAAQMDGTYYLTYHRFATPRQLERCHGGVRAFCAAKRRFDPHGVFQSDWWRHYARHLEECPR
jgi:FAD/FMN-containing dehydrogenase